MSDLKNKEARTNPTQKPMFKDVLREKALTIHADHSLDELCSMRSSPLRNKALYKIMLNGGEFLGPYWIGIYFPMSYSTLNTIFNKTFRPQQPVR